MKYEQVGCGDLILTPEIPEWIADWSDWTKEQLLPEWTVELDVSDYPDRTNAKVRAKSSFDPQYLSALVVFGRDLADNTEGQLCVVHEFVHLFFARMGAAQRQTVKIGDAAHKQLRGITNYDVNSNDFEPVMAVADRGYDAAEEETVVKLSRILVGMRQRELNNGNAQEIATVDAAADDA